MIYIKEYGTKKSCTNYVKLLLEYNFKDAVVLSNILGSKHKDYLPDLFEDKKHWMKEVKTDLLDNVISEAIKKSLHDDIFYVVCVKNPYAWIHSYSKFREEKKLTVAHMKPYIEIWNKSNKQWIKELLIKKPTKSTYIKYEDLIETPEEELIRIQKKFRMQKKHNFKNFISKKFRFKFNRLRNGTDVRGIKNIFLFRRFTKKNFYKKKEYLDIFNKRMLQEINDNVDPFIMDYFKYTVEK
jgi:hypothetical protein